MAEFKHRKKAPCQEACPAGVDVPRYIRYLKAGRYGEALGVIRESMPFPGVCGYACLHPCELKCARTQYDEPVGIRLLKRAAYEMGSLDLLPEPEALPPTGKKVAVIGAGPCGLSAAYYLARQGHKVTVYEARPLAGGMLRYAIPAFRLPREVIEQEIAWILLTGVEIKTSHPVRSASELLSREYDAVFAASGAWAPKRSGLEVSGIAKVVDALAFLTGVNSGQVQSVNGKVVVIGGGNTALDAARAALRLGAEEVILLYRRTRSEMPADPEEVRDAESEGVTLEFQAAPLKLINDQLFCTKTGERGTDGKPLILPGSEFSLQCDFLIEAVGLSADAQALELPGNPDGTVQTDSRLYSAGKPGIFAAGDVVTGPSSIIQAISQGKAAASSIDRFLGGSGLEETAGKTDLEFGATLPLGSTRPGVRKIPPAGRIKGFALVEQGFDRAETLQEAGRCLGCDVHTYQVDVNFSCCKDCAYCREVCGLGVFETSLTFNSGGYRPMLASQPEKCVGCLKCMMICPDFAISVSET